MSSQPRVAVQPSLAFVASQTPESAEAAERLHKRYDAVRPEEADVIVALGGDGLMLQVLHAYMDGGKPIYGMHRGSVGFMMNDYNEDDLVERIARAEPTEIHPLVMRVTDSDGEENTALAINEVSMLRQTYQTAKLRIMVDGQVRMAELSGDGVLVATPAGSTAYNLSAHGPIIPIDAPLLALTPISPFRPRRWRGALLPNEAKIAIEVIEPDKRPVSAVADHTEFRSVLRVEIEESRHHRALMLFDPGHNLRERILAEQFGY